MGHPSCLYREGTPTLAPPSLSGTIFAFMDTPFSIILRGIALELFLYCRTRSFQQPGEKWRCPLQKTEWYWPPRWGSVPPWETPITSPSSLYLQDSMYTGYFTSYFSSQIAQVLGSSLMDRHYLLTFSGLLAIAGLPHLLGWYSLKGSRLVARLYQSALIGSSSLSFDPVGSSWAVTHQTHPLFQNIL